MKDSSYKYGTHSEEFRQKWADKVLKVSDTEEKVCQNLIDALTVEDFSPSYFENPEIQKFYKNLQAFALEEENPEDIEDLLQPDLEGLEENKSIIQQFNEVFKLGVDYKPIPHRRGQRFIKNKAKPKKYYCKFVD